MCVNISGQLTVYFDCPFWVGVFEVYSDNSIKTCRIVFGSEPKDAEIYNLILNDYYSLPFSKPMPIDTSQKNKKPINPKRMQRQIKKLVNQKGIGTKAQQALNRQRENNKKERVKTSKEKRNREKEFKFELKQKKKKEKHKGH